MNQIDIQVFFLMVLLLSPGSVLLKTFLQRSIFNKIVHIVGFSCICLLLNFSDCVFCHLYVFFFRLHVFVFCFSVLRPISCVLNYIHNKIFTVNLFALFCNLYIRVISCSALINK